MNKIKLTGWNGEEDYESEEFEIFGIVPIPEIVGDSVEYINNVIEKKVKIRIGYQIKFPPYKKQMQLAREAYRKKRKPYYVELIGFVVKLMY